MQISIFKIRKAFVFFIFLRTIVLLFTLNIYSQFTRTLGDAPQLLKEVTEYRLDGISSFFFNKYLR